MEFLKEELRHQISHLSHEYLSLVDLAYDSLQNRLFEMKTIELLTEECEFGGLHLGGSRKPDGIVYTTNLNNNYGIIIDTKAYAKGYSLPISQADEMERYVRENLVRDEKTNPSKWWVNFSKDISEFYFLFISGHFTGNYKNQIKRLSISSSTKGNAVEISNLLLYADKLISKEYGYEDIKTKLFETDEF
ncbi:MAG: hypothetical protein LBC96_06360 [Lachnospiraceae bacterium]|jgi:hypothetical protein|nr:hypothetical protein [Lachnospiraceae bacterium]